MDTAEGENELTPIRNLFNEWYARDISNKIKGNAGEPMGQPPYGYIKDPDNPKRWIVDEEAATTVRRIYQITLDGFEPEQIAAALERDSNLIGKHKDAPPTKWNSSTVTKILSLQEYCGDVLQSAPTVSQRKRQPAPSGRTAVLCELIVVDVRLFYREAYTYTEDSAYHIIKQTLKTKQELF
ncbi:MAG: recombinase family protein [Oscillospiraceae bacterium]|nr:recombinase family protein [Oscillospiraceae bacterium]